MIHRHHKERKFLYSEYSPEGISCGAFFFNSPDLLGNALDRLLRVSARSPAFMEGAQQWDLRTQTTTAASTEAAVKLMT
jgi:hypothetical protein